MAVYDNPQLEGEAVDILRRALNLPNAGGSTLRISNATCGRLRSLLGNENIQHLQEDDRRILRGGWRGAEVSPQAAERILYAIVQRRGELATVLSDLSRYAPGTQIDVHGNRPIQELVRHPESPQARAAALYYSLRHSSVPHLEDAFMYIRDPAMYQRLQTILRMRALHDRMLADEENFGIGRSGVVQPRGTPLHPTHRTGRIGEVADQIDALQRQIAALPVNTPVADFNALHAEVRTQRTKIRELEDRRNRLQRNFDELNREITSLNTLAPLRPLPHLNAAAFAQAFQRDSIRPAWGGAATVPIAVAYGNYRGIVRNSALPRTSYTLAEWLTDEDARRTADSLSSRYRASPCSPPPAGMVLQDLVERGIGGALGDQREAGVREIQRLLTAVEGGRGSAGGGSGGGGAEGGGSAGSGPTPHTPSVTSSAKKPGIVRRGLKGVWDVLNYRLPQ